MRAWRATQLELFFLKLVKKREADYANSTVSLQNPLTVNNECVRSACHTPSFMVHSGTLDPSTQLEEKPHFKKYPTLIQGQEEVHLQPQMNPDWNHTVYMTCTCKPEIQVQRLEHLQNSRANSVSPSALAVLSLSLQLNHQDSLFPQFP